MNCFLENFFLKSLVMVVVVVLFISFFPTALFGNDTGFSKEEKLLISTVSGFAAITTWGVLNWDYFDKSPQKGDEGWFSDNTKYGGQDKIGHFFFSYSLSHLFSALYEDFGYSSDQGAFLGAVSSVALGTWMEIGDSFSDYGFSYEDMVMNLLGSATGYFLYTHPGMSEKIDLRMEYMPNSDEFDFTTDYDHQKFLLALKFNGFEFAQNNYLKYFELHLGYYTRGYPDKYDRERNVYIGIGLNVSRLFKQISMPKVSKVFNYIQIPYTYIELNHDVDQ